MDSKKNKGKHEECDLKNIVKNEKGKISFEVTCRKENYEKRFKRMSMANQRIMLFGPFSFYGHKLKPRYAGRYIDFNTFNFTDYNEAINSCIDESMVSQPRIVSEYEQHLMKYLRPRSKIDLFSIREKYMRTECHTHTIFTQLVSRSQQKKKGNETVFVYHISMRHAHEPDSTKS